MREIREIGLESVDQLVGLAANAYPGRNFFSEQARQALKERFATSMKEDEMCRHYGMFSGKKMIGGMKFFDFDMTLLSVPVKAGGLGLVCVDLLRKKEKVAKDMLQYYLHHYRDRGVHLAILYPFRVDFYRQMGFGAGTKMNQYRFLPESLPRGGNKRNVEYLTAADMLDIVACYNRYASRTNGMMAKTTYEIRGMFASPDTIAVGYRRDGELVGYLLFAFQRGSEENFVDNDLLIKEMIVNEDEAYLGLFAFLRSQADQVHRIIYHTQDECFHQILTDPRNGSNRMIPSVYHESNAAAVGIMYRVLDVAGIFRDLQAHDFGGQTCKLKITVEDSFFPDNEGSTVVSFDNGTASVVNEQSYDVEITMDIADFSSMLVGAVPFGTLLRYGAAKISDKTYAGVVSAIFGTSEKPVCTTPF